MGKRGRSAATDGFTIDFTVGDADESDDPGPLHRHHARSFRENSGVIAEGRFRADGIFVASEILAKHDENYMPPELSRRGLHKTETLR